MGDPLWTYSTELRPVKLLLGLSQMRSVGVGTGEWQTRRSWLEEGHIKKEIIGKKGEGGLRGLGQPR